MFMRRNAHIHSHYGQGVMQVIKCYNHINWNLHISGTVGSCRVVVVVVAAEEGGGIYLCRFVFFLHKGHRNLYQNRLKDTDGFVSAIFYTLADSWWLGKTQFSFKNLWCSEKCNYYVSIWQAHTHIHTGRHTHTQRWRMITDKATSPQSNC